MRKPALLNLIEVDGKISQEVLGSDGTALRNYPSLVNPQPVISQ
jgi:hypothetical protein